MKNPGKKNVLSEMGATVTAHVFGVMVGKHCFIHYVGNISVTIRRNLLKDSNSLYGQIFLRGGIV